MCLTKISKRSGFPKEQTGYKVFEVKRGKYYPPIILDDSGPSFSLQKWAHEKLYRSAKWREVLQTTKGRFSKYRTGFHYFLTKEAAYSFMKSMMLAWWYKGEAFAVCRIKARKITVLGTQEKDWKTSELARSGVAKEIKIMEVL